MLGYQRVAALVVICSLMHHASASTEYLVGLGKADITGPVADINLMGYANPSQIAGGIHTRLFARAFIVADPQTPSQRFVFVNLDACMASQAVTFTVIDRLKQHFGEELYTEQNVALSGTHTHSGPAGYLQYLIYDVTGMGFVPQTFHAVVDGIVSAVVQAHESLQPGKLHLAREHLIDTNVNRSPTAYYANPKEEVDGFHFNVDKEMSVVVFEDEETEDAVGVFSWFAVHGTSMNNTNELVNGDNKGAAAQFMERWARKRSSKQEETSTSANGSSSKGTSSSSTTTTATTTRVSDDFIAAFCQANVGDTSPNTLGAYCIDTGLPCDAVHSTCGGRVQQCIGRGPGWPDHFASTKIIASQQAEMAQKLLQDRDAQVEILGPIDFRHMYLDMRDLQVESSSFTRAGRTCKPAMGFAFAAGTTDGPGAFDFRQGDTNGTAFWRLVRDFIHDPTPEQEACHAPKPILLDVGEMHYPYEWVPYIVEIQILRVGQLVLLAVPGEFTTMAGRRLRAAVKDVVAPIWGEDVHLVIAGLSNTYSSYITTWEEYQEQRYEGGFTLYGPSTLDAYIQEFRRLATAMVEGAPTSPGPSPPNLLPKQWSLVPGVVVDAVPPGANFGQVTKNVEAGKKFVAGDVVSLEFRSGCPRNNIRAEGTFLTVEKFIDSTLVQKKHQESIVMGCFRWFRSWLWWGHRHSSSGSRVDGGATVKALQTANNDADWEVVHTDNDWETKFSWRRHQSLSPLSYASITWEIPQDVVPGIYRIKHYGDRKHLFGHVESFEGISREFEVVDESQGKSKGSWSVAFWQLFGRRVGGML